MSKKQYGLIIPKQQKAAAAAIIRKSVFDEDNELHDEDDEEETLQLPDRKGPSLIPMTSKTNNLQRLEINKALEEDPNIFEYDDVYDDVKGKNEASSSKAVKKEAKYMTNLLKSAELRKREHERREEKKIQKEREEEGSAFQDKEAFITTAYKEKLKELKETEEREERESRCENLLDVRKQKDLSGFYRHFLNQSLGAESIPLQSSSDRFETKKNQHLEELSKESFKQLRGTKRNLRNRRDSASSSEAEADEKPEEVSSPKRIHVNEPSSSQDIDQKINEPQTENLLTSNDKDPEAVGSNPDEKEVVQEPKIDRQTLIRLRFEKRTVGKVFDDALERYRQRKGLSSAVS